LKEENEELRVALEKQTKEVENKVERIEELGVVIHQAI
jgi:hypothetical protein